MRTHVFLALLVGLVLLYTNVVSAQNFIDPQTRIISTSLSSSELTGTSYYGDPEDDEDSNTLTTDERLSRESENPFPIIARSEAPDDDDTTGDSSDATKNMAVAGPLVFAVLIMTM